MGQSGDSAELRGQPAEVSTPLSRFCLDSAALDADMATPLFIELFCYEARLSSHMKRSGFRTLSLDIFRAHVRFESAVTFVDLATEDTASR
eukprot:24915-Amphidinium_carterae.1